MADDKIIIEFDGDIKALKAKLAGVKKQTSALNKAAGGIGKAISASAGAAAVAFAGVSAGIAGAVAAASKMEGIATQFEVLTGSAKKATAIMKELQEFSAATPFQFEGISSAAQQLLGFGFEAEEIVPKLKQIGDVASAIGKPIEEVGFIFGQVSAAGKLTGERLLQFQERAIPIGPAIAKTMGVAEESIKDLVSKGEVDFATFEKAFQSLADEGGFAFGGMIKQSKTFGGLLSTVSDNVALLAAEIGQELLPAAKLVAEGFLGVLKSLRETDNFITTSAKHWGSIIADSFTDSDTEVKKSLSQVKEELTEIDKKVEQAQRRIDQTKGSSFAKFFGGQKAALETFSNLLEERTSLLQRQTEIEKDIAERADAGRLAKLEETRAVEAEATKEAMKLKQEALKEASEEAFEEELARAVEKVEILDEAKLAQLQTGLQKEAMAKEIADAKDLKRQGKYDKANEKLIKARTKQQIEVSKASIALERATTQGKLDVVANGLALANAITGKETKAAFIASKALAIAQIAVNRGIAMGAIPAQTAMIPYPANLAAAGNMASLININAGLAAATVAAQAITGFAEGGAVEGGIAGMDSVPVLAQRGEIVAPRQNFEEVIGSVRAQRAAEELGVENAAGGAMEVIVAFKDDAFEIIEEKILERRNLGIGAI